MISVRYFLVWNYNFRTMPGFNIAFLKPHNLSVDRREQI